MKRYSCMPFITVFPTHPCLRNKLGHVRASHPDSPGLRKSQLFSITLMVACCALFGSTHTCPVNTSSSICVSGRRVREAAFVCPPLAQMELHTRPRVPTIRTNGTACVSVHACRSRGPYPMRGLGTANLEKHLVGSFHSSR